MSKPPSPYPGTHPPTDQKPFVAPCNDLRPGAVWRWLRQGWRDYRRAPGLSLTWGLIVWGLSLGMAALAWGFGEWVLLLSALTGFLIVAPLLAFAMYTVPRKLDHGEQPGFVNTLRAIRRPLSNALIYALVLLVVFLVWVRAGAMINVFAPVETGTGWPGWLMFLGVGSAVGAVFAAVVFAASAVSLPFIANREVDVVTAVISSINAVLRNPVSMAAWAVTIVVLVMIGMAPAGAGLVLVIPWLAYASWHAYQETLQLGDWPTLTSD